MTASSSAGDTLFSDQTITVTIGDVTAATITGTSGADIINPTTLTASLRTTVEDDAINGGDGNDIIDGGLGADLMSGGNGDDEFYVDNVGDIVNETLAVGSGNNDRVFSSVSFSMGDATSGLDHLTLTGTGNINGTGNTLANTITGNTGANILNGGTGCRHADRRPGQRRLRHRRRRHDHRRYRAKARTVLKARSRSRSAPTSRT